MQQGVFIGSDGYCVRAIMSEGGSVPTDALTGREVHGGGFFYPVSPHQELAKVLNMSSLQRAGWAKTRTDGVKVDGRRNPRLTRARIERMAVRGAA